MRQVVGLEVAGIDAQPLAAEDIVRAEQIGRRRILDDAADLGAGEVGDGVVGGLLEQEIAVGAEEWQAAARPASSYAFSRSSGLAASAGFMLKGKKIPVGRARAFARGPDRTP